jgi:hypothetical protein
MNNQDKEAFVKWQESKPWIGDWAKMSWCKEAWQAALEYERFNHKYCVVGSLDKLCEKLEAENKELRNALEFYANNQTTMTTENGIYLRDGLNGDFFPLKEKARKALKEVDEL